MPLQCQLDTKLTPLGGCCTQCGSRLGSQSAQLIKIAIRKVIFPSLLLVTLMIVAMPGPELMAKTMTVKE
jgi:hypothetical protein